MIKIIFSVLDWSEVWAPIIPLLVFLVYPNQPHHLKPVVIYIWLSWFLNIIIDLVWIVKRFFPFWLQSNNPIYNIQSLVRFICFSVFFIGLPQKYFMGFKKIIPILFALFIFLNFSLFEKFFNPDHLSGNLLSAEAFLLLAYCMLFYLAELQEDSRSTSIPNLWVVTGLSIYVVISFFVFLFYVPMESIDGNLSDHMWNFHNIAFIILCVFIAKAFYDPFRYRYTV